MHGSVYINSKISSHPSLQLTSPGRFALHAEKELLDALTEKEPTYAEVTHSLSELVLPFILVTKSLPDPVQIPRGLSGCYFSGF
jgi:hypothetical protein